VGERASLRDGFTLMGVVLRRGAATVLAGIDAEIPAGCCTGVTGPSGAGKSTLLRLLNRLEDPAAGRVLLDGTPLLEWDVLALRRRVVLVGQQPVLLSDTVGAELRVAAPQLSEDGVADLLGQVGLPTDLGQRGTTGLSGGEAQRVCLARALAVQPAALLLDEPTSGLDAASAAAIETLVDALVAAGRTVVVVSHHTRWIRRVAHHVLVLDRGRLTAVGKPGEIDYLRSSR
jgi:putative ABC transport system ATP-binding protein